MVLPVPSQSTTITMTMPALVTLHTNKQDLNKVISRSQNQNSKEGQSVFGVFGIKISRFPLSAKTTQPSTVHQPEAERDHFHEQFTNIHPCIIYTRLSCSGLRGAGAYPSMHLARIRGTPRTGQGSNYIKYLTSVIKIELLRRFSLPTL